jgi:serine/threonine protein kinase
VSLDIGTRLGPYEVLAKLGEGGMGEVYRAHDTKLGRDVALKVLPDAVAANPERLMRFEREAKTLAALNHPHVAQVYGFEDSGTVRALVMELVPGESLAARIALSAGSKDPAYTPDGAPGLKPRGLPVREALELARQIAEGLEAAHDKGIIHRDLKPTNVQVTPDGQVKILDFGLAKALDAGSKDPASIRETEISPTLTAGTRHGVILGTAAYMSPEQARGRPVDARTDIWAFGGVLYEMLTGVRAFPGPTVTDLLAQILERDPDWTALPAGLPPAIRYLLQRCLSKDPRQRLHHIADARFTIEEAIALPGSKDPGLHPDVGSGLQSGAVIAPAPPTRAVWRHPLPLGLALASICLGGALAWSLDRTPAALPKEPTYLSLMLPPDQEIAPVNLAISPDGRDIVYSGVTDASPPGPEGNVPRLYHRRLTEPASRALPGTENGMEPFFSPDGASVAFYSTGDLKLRKVALGGGGPVELTSAPWLTIRVGPGFWTTAGVMLLGDSAGPIRRVPAGGGTPEIVVPRTALERGETGAIEPRVLPGGVTLFLATPGARTGHLAVWDGAKRRTLLPDVGASYRLFGPGYLLFWRRAGNAEANLADLYAVPFDPARARLRGEPVALLTVPESGAPVWDLSESGTLVYREFTGSRGIQYMWLPQGNRPAPPAFGPLPRADVPSFRVSPNGRQVLYHQSFSRTDQRLVLADLATHTTRTVAAGTYSWFAWTPDGRRVVYQESPDSPGGAGMSWRAIDGSAPAERLTSSKAWQQPQFVTRDGRSLVYQESGGVGTQAPLDQAYDLWLLPLDPRGQPRPLLRTKANERLAHLSPDQKWMAYVSDETGRDEVWVRAFPEGATAVQVSQDGGTEPVWAPDGRTLYYRDWSGTNLRAVPVTAGAVPQFGTPVSTRGHWSQALPYGRRYDIDPVSGALLLQHASTFGRELRVVLNFDEVIRRKMAEVKK